MNRQFIRPTNLLWMTLINREDAKSGIRKNEQ